MFPKAGFVKGLHECGQLRGSEERFSRNRQRPQVQHGPIEFAFPARVGDQLERFPALGEVEKFVRVKADEFTRPNDL
jgi:hypothetical protein